MQNLQHTCRDRDSSDVERHCYNAAFGELGLTWFWDEQTYADLQAIPEQRSRVVRYVRANHPHLLTAYDADFLAEAIEVTRLRLGVGRAG